MRTPQFTYVSDGVDPKQATTLDELFGRKKQLDLPYSSLAELDKDLKTMNLLDMQSLAIKMGIKPTSDRHRLVRACQDQFIRLTKTYGVAKSSKDKGSFDPSKF
jgi:hypothetical protein